MTIAKIRAILKSLDVVGIAVFVVVFVLTLVAQIIAVSAAGIAELAGRLTDLGEGALADIADRTPPAESAYVVTAMRTRDVPAWSTR